MIKRRCFSKFIKQENIALLFLTLIILLNLPNFSRYSSRDAFNKQNKDLIPLNQSFQRIKPLSENNNGFRRAFMPKVYTEEDLNIFLYGDAFYGYNLISYGMKNRTSQKCNSFASIVDMEGNIITERLVENYTSGPHFPHEFINSTTILLGTPKGAVLWDIYSNRTVEIGNIGHHEYEYNPNSDTIFYLYHDYITINDTTYLYDVIGEFNLSGHIVWSLNTSSFVKPSQWCPYQDMQGGAVDITHSNSVFYNPEDDVLYLNSRSLNTFYKIDHKTSQVIWGLGEYGNFTLFDRYGNNCSNLFYHAHAVEEVEDNVFILFDNDYHNQTDHRSKNSRILEIKINETTMTANESWSWIAPTDYYSPYYGDADRLPNGNRLGTFGVFERPPPSPVGARLVEVNEDGQIVWEMNFTSRETHDYGMYRADRFRLSPILNSPDDFLLYPEYGKSDVNILISWQTWYNFRNKWPRPGYYELYLNGTLIQNSTFDFSKYWLPKNLTFDLQNLEIGNYNLTLGIFDEGGHLTTDEVNISVKRFIIDRTDSISLEFGQTNSFIQWSGETSSHFWGNITINNTLLFNFEWTGDITLDSNLLEPGLHLISLNLFNSSKLVFNDTFWVTVYPSEAPLINSFSADQTVTWNETVTFSWEIFDQLPSSWIILVNGIPMVTGSQENRSYQLDWSLPVLDEGFYNMTLACTDLLGQMTASTTWITIIPPEKPVFTAVPSQIEFQWGQANASLTWEVHGGTQWVLWKNSTMIRSGTFSNNSITLLIEHWQFEGWGLGRYNVTLQVINETGASASSILMIRIWINLGDKHADTIILGSSLWYSSGEKALGAPDGASAEIFMDYGNGYLTLDMGNSEEIIDGNGTDFIIVAQGGNYSVYVKNDLNSIFTYLGWSNSNASFDLATIGMSVARYIRVEYRSGATVELDAVVASHYNEPEADTDPPLINGPIDFWIWENQTMVTLTWDISDVTPWNYSLRVDGVLAEVGPWNGSILIFTLDVSNKSGQVQVSLVLRDIFKNHAEDMVAIEIRPLESSTTVTSTPPASTPYPLPALIAGLGLLMIRRKLQRKSGSKIQHIHNDNG